MDRGNEVGCRKLIRFIPDAGGAPYRCLSRFNTRFGNGLIIEMH